MQEPLKTQMISAWGFVTIAVWGGSIWLAYSYFGVWAGWLAFLASLGSFFTMLVLNRIEYGEWSKGVPWWERMAKDGYRPPIKFPSDPPNTAP